MNSKLPQSKSNFILEILETHALNAFKMSMLNFDQELFYNTYNRLLEEKSFREVFYDLFIPIIQDIGFAMANTDYHSLHMNISYLYIFDKKY